MPCRPASSNTTSEARPNELAGELGKTDGLDIPPAIRLPKGKMRKPDELRRAVQLAARKTAPDGAILVLLDADDDCPALLGPELLAHVRSGHGDRATSVVVAQREYESWFIAKAAGLRGYRGLPDDLTPEDSVEKVRDAEGWLDVRLQSGYHETTDQPKLSQRFELEGAMRMASFQKLRRDLARILGMSPQH